MAKEYVIDCEKIKFRDEKYIEQLAQFLQERLQGADISINGNAIKIASEKDISKKNIKLFANKFLYQAGLKKKYRLVSLVKSELGDGFLVVEY